MADVITRFKVESSEYEKKIKSAKGQMDGFKSATDKLSSALGVNVGALAKFGTAIGAISGALQVAKDAFAANELFIDEWGRTVESAKAVYEGFLTSLNTGDISGFLSRIDQITKAAREAYDEMDRLSTQKAIQNPQLKKQEAENERIRTMLRTGRYIAPTDGRKAAAVEGSKLSDAQIKYFTNALKGGVENANKIILSQITQTTKTIDSLYNEQAKTLGMSQKEFRKGTSSMEEFDKRMEGFKKFVEFESKNTTTMSTSMGTITTRNGVANPYEKYRAWGVFKDDGDLFGRIQGYINDRASLQSQYYSATGQAYRNINTAENKLGGGSGGGRGGHTNANTPPPAVRGTIDWFEQEITKLNKELTATTDAEVRINVQTMIDQYTAAIEELKQELNLDIFAGRFNPTKSKSENDSWLSANGNTAIADSISSQYNPAFSTQLNIDPNELQKTIDRISQGGKVAKSAWMEAANAVGSVGQALQQIDNPAAKVFGIIAEAVANVASGFAQALANSKTGKLSVWEWIAEAAAGTATMISTIAAIKSATSGNYAEGGIIPGNSPSGDNLQLYGVNSQELILNRAQAGNLASQLQGTGMQSMHLTATIHGEDIRLALNNNSRRRGKGEYVTSR